MSDIRPETYFYGHRPSPNTEPNPILDLVVGVLSCKEHVDRQQRCLRTWMGELHKLKIPAFFIVGGGTGDEIQFGHPHQWIVPGTDDRQSLTRKVCRIFEWLPKVCSFRRFFKCDDDTYIHPQRLIDFARQSKQHAIGQVDTIHEATCFLGGGAGYLLSPLAVSISREAENFCTSGYHEDVNVGRALLSAGVTLTHDDRLYWADDAVRWPSPTNRLISCHLIRSDEVMDRIHLSNASGAITRSRIRQVRCR